MPDIDFDFAVLHCNVTQAFEFTHVDFKFSAWSFDFDDHGFDGDSNCGRREKQKKRNGQNTFFSKLREVFVAKKGKKEDGHEKDGGWQRTGGRAAVAIEPVAGGLGDCSGTRGTNIECFPPDQPMMAPLS